MGDLPGSEPPVNRLISRTPEEYGRERFQDHLLEQYKLYVESSQKVSEKRISTANYLLTVTSSLVTLFGLALTISDVGAWLAVIPLAGLLVSLTWYSLVVSYKNLNTAKFKVIHELEDYLPAALFRYEWHSCEQGQGKVYRPITHVERWIPLIFASVFLILGAYSLCRRTARPEVAKSISVSGSVDLNVKSPVVVEQQNSTPKPNHPQRPSKR